ncbi:MAG: hypothetical protein HN712_22135 [Gemmatimonadetes bacterium]|nr:hypothetical protein [Gemmatimonadota bacterium]MBT7863029.1 hypothetical protein [Gemmatimonadota bacterium]
MNNSLAILSRRTALLLLLMLLAAHAWPNSAAASPASGPCTVTIKGNDHGTESIKTYDQWLFPSGSEETFRNGNASLFSRISDIANGNFDALADPKTWMLVASFVEAPRDMVEAVAFDEIQDAIGIDLEEIVLDQAGAVIGVDLDGVIYSQADLMQAMVDRTGLIDPSAWSPERWNDKMTEVGFRGECGGARVTLYWDTDYRGGSREFLGSAQDATYGMDGDWPGQVSSYRVSFPPMPAPVPDFTTAWTNIEGNAVDVGAGADGSVWVIDNHSNQIYRDTGSGWVGMGGQAKRIDGGPDGDAYVVVDDGGVWYGNGTVGSWAPVSGHAVDVGAGANGFVWCIGLDSRIWRHNPSGGDYWIDMGGQGVRVDAGPNGDAYVVTADGSVWYGNGTVGNWVPMPKTRAIDIGVGDDGRVWITHADGGIRRLNENRTRWERTAGHAQQISVGAGGTPWVVQESTQIWSGTPQ